MTTAVGHAQLFDQVTLSPVKFMKSVGALQQKKKKNQIILRQA